MNRQFFDISLSILTNLILAVRTTLSSERFLKRIFKENNKNLHSWLLLPSF